MWRCFGIGGDALRGQGVRLVAHIDGLSAIGIRAGIQRLGRIGRAWVALRGAIATHRPRAALLVDAPELNLPLARILKKMGVPVVLYVGPQVWAWRPHRLSLLKARTDVVALVLPFEKPLYDRAGVRSAYVGHPVLDREPLRPPELVRERLRRSDDKPVVAMLPGSRPGELAHHLPPMVDAGVRLAATGVQVVVAPPPFDRDDRHARAILSRGLTPLPASVSLAELLQIADAAIVASGTATLETAMAKVPMAIVYRVDRLSFGLGRHLFRIPFIGLPNWIAGRKIVPELYQDDVNGEGVFEQATALLDPTERARQVAALSDVAAALGPPGVASRVAALVNEPLS